MTLEYQQRQSMGMATVLTAWDGTELADELTIDDRDRAWSGEPATYRRILSWKLQVDAERRRFHWDAAERVKRRTLNLWEGTP